MSWWEAQWSIQLLAELRVGAPTRASILASKAQEDASFASGVDALTRQEGPARGDR